jgi:hypothetical protein
MVARCLLISTPFFRRRVRIIALSALAGHRVDQGEENGDGLQNGKENSGGLQKYLSSKLLRVTSLTPALGSSSGQAGTVRGKIRGSLMGSQPVEWAVEGES